MAGGIGLASRFFDVESDGCLVTVVDLLTNDILKTTQFTVRIISDNIIHS